MDPTKTILSLYKKDKKEAFRLFFDTYHEPLLLYCQRILKEIEVAEDVVQECFIHFYIHERFENFSGDLGSFLFRAAKNTCLNYLRNQQRRINLYETAGSEKEDAVFIPEENEQKQIDILYMAINNLPEECRKIFLKIFVDDMKYQDVADELKISVNTVKTQVRRAIKYLQEALEGQSFISVLLLLTKIKPLFCHQKHESRLYE